MRRKIIALLSALLLVSSSPALAKSRLPSSFVPGVTPETIDRSYLRLNPPGQRHGMSRKAEVLPENYDLRDYGRVPSTVRNQNPHGTCWAHAALGSMESSYLTLKMGREIDFSEFHLAWYSYGDGRKGKHFGFTYPEKDILNQTGNIGKATAILSRTGAILEAKLPYPVYEDYDEPSSVVPESLAYLPFDYYLSEMRHISAAENLDMDEIKKAVMNHGAVYVSYYSGQGATSPEGGRTAYFDCSHGISTDHAVLIAGWDDNFPREDFSDNDSLRPSRNGAWLIRNSWGGDWPYPDGDGYFWMSYEQYIGAAASFIIGKNPSGGILRHYGHDDLGHTYSLGATKTCWAANVFRSARDEYITRVGFYTTDNNASCTVSIYKHGSEFPASPVDGVKLWTVSADFDYAGYHTINIPHITSSSHDFLPKGGYFSVVVKFTNSSNIPSVAVEREAAYGTATVNEKESYISNDGRTWQDMKYFRSGGTAYPSNACIKAFTVGDEYPEDEAMPPEKPEIPDEPNEDIPYYEEEGRDGLSWETAYVIDSANDLKLLASRINSKRDFSSKYYKLECDIDLTDETEWEGIGYYYYYSYYGFYGHFDGQGHTISLNISSAAKANTSTASRAGLFFSINGGGSVRNLNVVGSVVTKGDKAGGITEALNFGTIENCTFSGTIKSGSIAGGIAGYIGCGYKGINSDTKIIRGCKFTGTCSAKIAGGIAGTTQDHWSVEDCEVSAGSIISASTAGGIAGSAYGVITITGNTSHAELRDSKYTGGVAGSVTSSFEGVKRNVWYGDYHQFGNRFDDGTEFAPKIITEYLPDGTMDSEYAPFQIEASGLSPFFWKVKGLPEGMSCSREGIVSGTPITSSLWPARKTSQQYDLTVNVSNDFGNYYEIVVLRIYRAGISTAAPPTITTNSLKSGKSCKKYSVILKAKGTKPITWSASGLPAGFSIDSESGKITGTTQYSGTYRVTVSAANSGGTTSAVMPLTISPAAPRVKVSKSKYSKVGTEYSAVFTASGTQPITWSIDGDLPEGLTFSDGIISGTPRTVFMGSVKVTATNAAKSATKTLSLKITGTSPKINTKSLPPAMAGQYYSEFLDISGSPALTVTVTGLPAGLAFDAGTMEVYGTPAEKGTYKVKITAVNALKKATKTVKLKVSAAEYSLPAYGHDGAEKPSGIVIAAVLPEISFDADGMRDFSVTLSDDIPEGAELVYMAGSDEPSDDDNIAEFYAEDGEEISAVPENRLVIFSAWFRKGVTYHPVIAVIY